MRAATSTQNMISKFGASLRWALEKEGVDAESCGVTISVCSEDDKRLMIAAFKRDFDSAVMIRYDRTPEIIVTHGVPVCIVVQQKETA